MANLEILGFGNRVEDQITLRRKLEDLLKGIKECYVTIFKPSSCEINSRLVGSTEDTPYIRITYEKPGDVESGQIEEIIKRLEEGGVKIFIEYHPIPLAQESPNLHELKQAIAKGLI